MAKTTIDPPCRFCGQSVVEHVAGESWTLWKHTDGNRQCVEVPGQSLNDRERRIATPVVVGDPATIHLYTDSLCAVVVGVTAKTVTVEEVDRDESTMTSRDDGSGWPVMTWQGDLSTRTGKVSRARFSRNRWRAPSGDGDSLRITIGISKYVSDYRH